MKATIWHNPRCGTSRNALARLAEKGVEAEIYLYLETPPSLTEIKAVLKRLNMRPSQLLRPKQAEGEAVEGASEEAILEAMGRHPILIQRPIVITAKGAVLARPPERLDTVL